MNQEKLEEMEEVLNSIFTPSFSALVEKYYSQLYHGGFENDQDIYTQDIIDFMDNHKTDYRQDLIMLCGVLASIVKQARRKIPELRFKNENKYRD